MQWARVKSYANNQGISIIGDLPIYVSYDSVDVWVHPELFQLDKSKTPVAVAGCPPDSFSPTGQLWGNPIYNWQQHEKTNYKWWRDRFKTAKKLYDVIRIDHFRGFEGYYAIPYESVTAEIGEWFRGPGINFFNALEDDLKDVEIIAEDLGFITEDVREMLEKTGFPGMKVLQFAFDTDGKSEYLPHNFTTTNCVCYTGTHDNETLLGWVESASPETIRFVKKYFRLRNVKDIPEEIIRCTWGSVAVLAIAQIQDFLSAPASDRMNTPSTLGGNWEFRTLTSDFNARLSKHILDLNQIYNRI
jgi:4-alpha-glucanotransferase